MNAKLDFAHSRLSMPSPKSGDRKTITGRCHSREGGNDRTAKGISLSEGFVELLSTKTGQWFFEHRYCAMTCKNEVARSNTLPAGRMIVQLVIRVPGHLVPVMQVLETPSSVGIVAASLTA